MILIFCQHLVLFYDFCHESRNFAEIFSSSKLWLRKDYNLLHVCPPSDFRDALSEILKRQNKWKFSLLGVNEGIWSTRGGAGLSTVGGVGTNDSIWRCLKTLRRVGQVSMGGQVLDRLGGGPL